ncbi:MAG: hypothetical protein OXN44_06880 [Acidimicrobiaceae bacterium]|nr:hypothetical protein [Acidimicrobiaceae bacterium]
MSPRLYLLALLCPTSDVAALSAVRGQRADEPSTETCSRLSLRGPFFFSRDLMADTARPARAERPMSAANKGGVERSEQGAGNNGLQLEGLPVCTRSK